MNRTGRFPASGYFGAAVQGQFHSWVVETLPELDQQELYNRWSFGRPWDDAAKSSNASLGATAVRILRCPSDISVVPGQGNLSYVVNGGFGWTVPTDCPIGPHWLASGFAQPPLDLNGDGVTCVPNGRPTRCPRTRSST